MNSRPVWTERQALELLVVVVDVVDVGDGFDQAGLFGVGSVALDAGVNVLDPVDAEGTRCDLGEVGEAGRGQEDNVAGFG